MQPLENTLVSRLTPARWRHSAFGMKFILTFGVGALAVKGVQTIERLYGMVWIYPALGCVSVALVITIGVLIFRIGLAFGFKSAEHPTIKMFPDTIQGLPAGLPSFL